VLSLRSLSSYLFGVNTADLPDVADAESADEELNRADRVQNVNPFAAGRHGHIACPRVPAKNVPAACSAQAKE